MYEVTNYCCSYLYESFLIQFSAFDSERRNIDLFIHYFCISESDVHKYTPSMKIEILEIQSQSGLSAKLKEQRESSTAPNSIAFWKYVPKVFRVFPGSWPCFKVHLRFRFIDICEQTCSSMNVVKSKFLSLSQIHALLTCLF